MALLPGSSLPALLRGAAPLHRRQLRPHHCPPAGLPGHVGCQQPQQEGHGTADRVHHRLRRQLVAVLRPGVRQRHVPLCQLGGFPSRLFRTENFVDFLAGFPRQRGPRLPAVGSGVSDGYSAGVSGAMLEPTTVLLAVAPGCASAPRSTASFSPQKSGEKVCAALADRASPTSPARPHLQCPVHSDTH